MICIFMILGKGLVSRDAASCTPGVKCFFIHYWSQQQVRLSLRMGANTAFAVLPLPIRLNKATAVTIQATNSSTTGNDCHMFSSSTKFA